MAHFYAQDHLFVIDKGLLQIECLQNHSDSVFCLALDAVLWEMVTQTEQVSQNSDSKSNQHNQLLKEVELIRFIVRTGATGAQHQSNFDILCKRTYENLTVLW